jgi:hypothetical protein
MKRQIFLCILVLINASNIYAKTYLQNWKLSLNCLGPICAGMSIEEANKAANLNLQELAYSYSDPKDKTRLVAKLIDISQKNFSDKNHCLYVTDKTLLGKVQFMVTNKKISRIEINKGLNKTISGIGLGDTEAKVIKTYGEKIHKQPNKYDSNGTIFDLILSPRDVKDKAYRLIFIVVNGKVTNIRSGFAEEVSWVEGCS